MLGASRGEHPVPREITVESVDDGRRLDRYLERIDGGLPSSLVRRLLRQRRVRVNDRRVRDGALPLAAGDRLQIHHDFLDPVPEVDSRRWTADPLEILHEDSDFLVVNKPAGVSCSDDGSDPAALQVWLREYLARGIEAGLTRPEPCHRLDRGTSGVVAVALTPAAFDRFRIGLQSGEVEKVYEVVVTGRPPRAEFECAIELRRSPGAGREDPRMLPGPGLPALTRFRVLASASGYTRLQARPVTGRTHQIRAHCLALDLPVVGDRRYGRKPPPSDPLPPAPARLPAPLRRQARIRGHR